MTLLATLGAVEVLALRPVMIARARQDGNGRKECRYGIRNGEDAVESAIKITKILLSIRFQNHRYGASGRELVSGRYARWLEPRGFSKNTLVSNLISKYEIYPKLFEVKPIVVVA